MGGAIHVESKAGVGSTFEFRLPYVSAAASAVNNVAGDAAAASAKPLAGISILVAEDDAFNQMLLEEVLMKSDGARLVIVGNGREALERVVRDGPGAYDLVLMDIQMPEMDGYETAKRILEVVPGLPIIGQTAHALREDREKCLAAGMVDHIAKPIDLEALVRLVRKYALRKRRN
jgi:CheY-like chemotaxis protein